MNVVPGLRDRDAISGTFPDVRDFPRRYHMYAFTTYSNMTNIE